MINAESNLNSKVKKEETEGFAGVINTGKTVYNSVSEKLSAVRHFGVDIKTVQNLVGLATAGGGAILTLLGNFNNETKKETISAINLLKSYVSDELVVYHQGQTLDEAIKIVEGSMTATLKSDSKFTILFFRVVFASMGNKRLFLLENFNKNDTMYNYIRNINYFNNFSRFDIDLNTTVRKEVSLNITNHTPLAHYNNETVDIYYNIKDIKTKTKSLLSLEEGTTMELQKLIILLEENRTLVTQIINELHEQEEYYVLNYLLSILDQTIDIEHAEDCECNTYIIKNMAHCDTKTKDIINNKLPKILEFLALQHQHKVFSEQKTDLPVFNKIKHRPLIEQLCINNTYVGLYSDTLIDMLSIYIFGLYDNDDVNKDGMKIREKVVDSIIDIVVGIIAKLLMKENEDDTINRSEFIWEQFKLIINEINENGNKKEKEEVDTSKIKKEEEINIERIINKNIIMEEQNKIKTGFDQFKWDEDEFIDEDKKDGKENVINLTEKGNDSIEIKYEDNKTQDTCTKESGNLSKIIDNYNEIINKKGSIKLNYTMKEIIEYIEQNINLHDFSIKELKVEMSISDKLDKIVATILEVNGKGGNNNNILYGKINADTLKQKLLSYNRIKNSDIILDGNVLVLKFLTIYSLFIKSLILSVEINNKYYHYANSREFILGKLHIAPDTLTSKDLNLGTYHCRNSSFKEKIAIRLIAPGWTTNLLPTLGYSFKPSKQTERVFVKNSILDALSASVNNNIQSDFFANYRVKENQRDSTQIILWAEYLKKNNNKLYGSNYRVGLTLKLIMYQFMDMVIDPFNLSVYNAWKSTTGNNGGNFSIPNLNEFPYHRVGSAEVINARITDFSTFTQILFKNTLPDVGWELSKWGNTIEIIFIEADRCNDTYFNSYWTLGHLSFPFNIVTFTGLIKTVENNGASSVTGHSTNKVNNVVLTSPCHNHSGPQKILYVVTDFQKSTQNIQFIGGITLQMVAHNIIGGVDTDISLGIRSIYSNVTNDVTSHIIRCNAAYDYYADLYGSPEDIQAIRDNLSEIMFQSNYSVAVDNDPSIVQTRFFNDNCQNRTELTASYQQVYTVNAPYSLNSAKGQVFSWLSPMGLRMSVLTTLAKNSTYHISIPADNYLTTAMIATRLIKAEIDTDELSKNNLYNEFVNLYELAICKTAFTDRYLQENSIPLTSLIFGYHSSAIMNAINTSKTYASEHLKFAKKIEGLEALATLNRKTTINKLNRDMNIATIPEILAWLQDDYIGKMTNSNVTIPEYNIQRISPWFVAMYITKVETYNTKALLYGEPHSVILKFADQKGNTTDYINNFMTGEVRKFVYKPKIIDGYFKENAKTLDTINNLTGFGIKEANQYWIWLSYMISSSTHEGWKKLFLANKKYIGWASNLDKCLVNFYFNTIRDQESIVNARRYDVTQSPNLDVNLSRTSPPGLNTIYVKYIHWNFELPIIVLPYTNYISMGKYKVENTYYNTYLIEDNNLESYAETKNVDMDIENTYEDSNSNNYF